MFWEKQGYKSNKNYQTTLVLSNQSSHKQCLLTCLPGSQDSLILVS